MNKVVVLAFAASWYRSYIPLFLFCLFKAYPDYDALVFLRKPLGVEEKLGMKIVRGMGNVEFVMVPGVPKLKNRAERVQLFQAARFLVFTPNIVYEHLNGYDYVYLTDVDMLLMPEKVPLHEQHLAHCDVLGLPYSNFVRNTDPPRLTGLHFAKRDFFWQIAPYVSIAAEHVKRNGLPDDLGNRGADEVLWYRIVKESGAGIPPQCPFSEQETWEHVYDPSNFLSNWFGPHHGVHVGFGRAMSRFRPIFELPFYKGYMRSLRKLRERDERFDRIAANLHPLAKAALKTVLRE